MRVLIVSSSRADWGLLAPVVAHLRGDRSFDVGLVVTGQHLMPGSNSRASIEAEGITINHTIDLGLSQDDSPAALSAAMGRALDGTGAVIAEARPDLLLILGDRYEILCVASAAVIANVPIAHLCGGDVTEGAIDDSIRHAITKLSSLHFVSNADSARRVAQLGESKDRIHNVGSPGLDRIAMSSLDSRDELLASVALPGCERFFVVTWHPATLSADSLDDCRSMLEALDQFPEFGLILTGSNADPGGRAIDAALLGFAAKRQNAVFHSSLGSHLYLSALAHADAVIGNSSSGLYEAPTFKLPTVNIGNRQQGRPRAASVIDCSNDTRDIAAAIHRALHSDCSKTVNPYGDGNAARRIASVLAGIAEPSQLLCKAFVDQVL